MGLRRFRKVLTTFRSDFNLVFVCSEGSGKVRNFMQSTVDSDQRQVIGGGYCIVLAQGLDVVCRHVVPIGQARSGQEVYGKVES
jgi:hypothetical protein